MDAETAREMLRAAFRSSSELQRLLATLKHRCSPDEYKLYGRRVATAIDAIGDALVNSAMAEHPELRSEVEDPVTASPIIATRTLLLRQHDAGRDVCVRLFAPEQGSGDWACRWEIDWPEGMRTSAAHGNDSIQALELALTMIGTVLYTSEHHKSGRLSSGNSWRGYGFPVPNTLRDLLEGDDAKYL